MVVPHLKRDDFFNYLIEQGCEEIFTGEYEDHRVFIKDGANSTIIPIKPAYYPLIVLNICTSLGIPQPDHIRHANEKWKAYLLSNGKNN